MPPHIPFRSSNSPGVLAAWFSCREEQKLVLLRGDIQHKDLWLIDLGTGAERKLTNLPADFSIRDFDISADGRAIVLERMQERSDVVLLDLARSR